MDGKPLKKVPERKCLGCDEMIGKKGLLRIVRNKDGEISLDLTGRKPGRGAYICRSAECFNKAQKRKSLERSLKAAIPQEVYDALRKEIEEMDNLEQ